MSWNIPFNLLTVIFKKNTLKWCIQKSVLICLKRPQNLSILCNDMNYMFLSYFKTRGLWDHTTILTNLRNIFIELMDTWAIISCELKNSLIKYLYFIGAHLICCRCSQSNRTAISFQTGMKCGNDSILCSRICTDFLRTAY